MPLSEITLVLVPFSFDPMRWILLALRLILAGVFLYAGLIKALSSGDFMLALLPFTFVPESWMGPIAFTLPWVEVAAGVALLLPWTVRPAAVLVIGLCAVFITALAWALANDIIVACSCFGQDEEPSRGAMIFAIVRDVALAVLAGVVLVFSRRRGFLSEALEGH